MGVWIGKGQLGFLDSKGNSDAESINGNIDLSRYDGPWKNDLFLAGLYGKSNGIVSAERWEAREQTNYTVSGDLFAFGGLRYEHDLFDGFQYQASFTAGFGYKLIATADRTRSHWRPRCRPDSRSVWAMASSTTRIRRRP
ncbi:MAG: DUF481 domain-containing protein [Steroidobacteraceae bacterium]